jgi:hypothetical protein
VFTSLTLGSSEIHTCYELFCRDIEKILEARIGSRSAEPVESPADSNDDGAIRRTDFGSVIESEETGPRGGI